MPNVTYSASIAYLQLVFNAQPWPGIAENVSVGAATQLYMSLHNADPGPTGNQSTNETAYTNYSRVAVPRSIAGFTVVGNTPVASENAQPATFPQCGATGDTLTYFGIGLSASGFGTLLLSGPITNGAPSIFTATQAFPGALTVPGAALSLNAFVACFAPGFQSLPGGITEGALYYVGTLAGETITLSTTPNNGNPVTTSSTGGGILIPVSPFAISNGVTPVFNAGGLTYVP